jgi:beta-glucosidase
VALREKRGTVNPLGLYDLDRNMRAVGRAYKQLIQDWRDVLPASSVCLTVPVVPPSAYDIMDQREVERAARVVNLRPSTTQSNPQAG